MAAVLRLAILTIGTIGFIAAGTTFLRSCGGTRVYEAKEHALLKSGEFVTIALSGGSAENPENTIKAFDRSSKGGAWIHFPLRLTKDNKLIAIKDDTVDRTTGGRGLVREHTLDEIKKLKVAGEHAVPTFDEILSRYPDTPIWAELLENSLPAAIDIVGKVNKAGRQKNFVFSSPHSAPLSEVRKLEPGWVTAAPADEADRFSILESLKLESVAALKGDFIVAPLTREKISVMSQALVDESHRRFKKVIAWNLNDEAEIKRALELKVDGIATEKPELLRGIIGSRSAP